MRKRRGRGEDGIYQRESDGLWVASVSLGYDGAGKRVRRVVYGKSKREAQAKLDALRRDAAGGVKIAPGRVTVKEAVDRWLDLEVRPNRAPATVKCYAETARLHILPTLGRVYLKDLDTHRIDQLQAGLQAAGVSPRTRELCHAVLSRCLRRTVKWGLIAVNPAVGAERPKVTRREVPRTSPEQAEALLKAAAGHRLAALFVVVVGTGLRQGEAFGLRWRDIDTAAGVLTVRHSLEELNGVLRLKSPKTASGVREVELPNAVRDALLAHRRAADGAGRGGPDAAVFCDANGGYLRKSNFLRNVYGPIAQAAGLSGVRFHDWRHYHAGMLIELGVDAKVVQQRIGHKDVGTTLRFYVHPRKEAHRAAADKFDGLFKAQKVKKPAGE